MMLYKVWKEEAAQLLATALALVAEDVDRVLGELADGVVQEFAVQGVYLKERLKYGEAGPLSLVKKAKPVEVPFQKSRL